MGDLRLYLRCVGASIRGQMQYRASFFMLAAGHALVVGMELAGVWMLFGRFGQIRGWTFPQVALLFGMALSRHPESLELLLRVIDEENAPTAAYAVASLAIYKNDTAVRERVRTVVEARGERVIAEEFQKRFPPRSV